MHLKQLSTTQRLAAGCGCVTILAVATGVTAMLWFSGRTSRGFERDLAAAPAGWTDSIRQLVRSPDLAEFLPARDLPGDGSAVVHDSALAWHRPSIEHAYRALINPAQPATSDDSAAWRAIMADTALDRFARAARMTGWSATDRVLGPEGSVARTNALAMVPPAYRDIRNVTRALVVRGVLRLERGDRGGARADFASATGLGERLLAREPVALGVFVGRAAISSGMRGWERYARAVRDSALLVRAGTIQAWAAGSPGRFTDLLIAAPDSALAIAADSTLALGMRSDAMRNVLAAWIVRPRGFLFGPPARVERALRRLAQSADRDAAALANMTATTAERMNIFAIGKMMREAQ